MNRRELIAYHSELTELLSSEPDRSERKKFLESERTTYQYNLAKKQARLRNLIKPILPVDVCDLPDEDRTEELVDRLIIIIWSKEVLNQYNSLPKENSAERRRARNLAIQTAERLLKSPQDINITNKAWRTNGAEQDDPQETQEPFSELVRKECASLIKDKWEDIKPEQLAQLVRIYASKDKSQESIREYAEGLLRNYFKGPKSRSQRIDAYYNFVSGVLDLAEEDEAFKEGMKIVLHATDILPKDPSLAEQTGLLSLPYGEAESVFKKLLIAKSVIDQLRFMGSWNFDQYFKDRENFIITDSAAIEKGNKRKGNVVRKIGQDATREMYYRMKETMRFIANGSKPLSEERKRALKDIWPFNLAFDEKDPLNQKFQKVFPQMDSSETGLL